ncbi:MAG: thiamine phosphate synthase [Bacteroidia bacterium]
MSRSFQIVVITSEHFPKNEILHIKKLFAAGLKILHVRKPKAKKEELNEFLTQIPVKFRDRIVIHDHYSLIREFRLKGAHLPEHVRNSKIKISFLKKNKIKIVSTSFHSIKSLKQTRRKYEYFFLSPVFDSISKQDYKSNFKLTELKAHLKKQKNAIALGGVTDKNIASTKKAGFRGAAALGYVWKGKNPVSNYRKLLSKIK